jgi:hypothetical protein
MSVPGLRREDFPVLDRLTYLNTASVGLVPASSECAMVVMAVSLPDKGGWLRRPSGRTALRRVCGDRLLLGHARSVGIA